jgi:hypothetical protein
MRLRSKSIVMLRYFILIFLSSLVLFFSGCGGKDRDIIQKNKLIDIIVDIHKVDAMAMSETFIRTYMFVDSVDLYTPVFEKHGISREQFEKSIFYYNSIPLEFDGIYDEVIAELTRQQTEFTEMQAAAARDTVNNLWKEKFAWSFPKEGRNNHLEVNIPLKGPGLYSFSAQIRLYKSDLSEDPAIQLWFWYNDSTEYGLRDSFPAVSIKKDEKLHMYNVSKRLTDTLYTHLKGFILDYSNKDTIFPRQADVFQIRFEKQDPD